MKPENLISEHEEIEQSAADHMKMIVADFDLPESYQRLINGPWRLVAQTIIEQFGEGSDAWSRMTWFTRILCTAIETSLERQTPEAVNDALNGFNIWLSSLREQGESYSLCVSAANYAQRRISAQIAEDTYPQEAPAKPVSEEELLEKDNDADVVKSSEDQQPVAETAAETATTSADTDNKPNTIETLSLSLAYSASQHVNEHVESGEQSAAPEEPTVSQPEHTERGTDMDIQSNAAVENNQPKAFETGAPANASLPQSGRLTEAASVSPVPMGTWLAFHDQDVPTLARLAMYDPSEDSFMLGNNNGILVRKISKAEFSQLISNDMVQLVEFRNITQ